MASKQMTVGSKVEVLTLAGNPKRVRKDVDHGQRFGDVTYVSRFGWANVRLENGYSESFWFGDLVLVDMGKEFAE